MEYIEDLQFKNLRIILSEELPKFTTDAVLLSDFARLRADDAVADFGTGTGILPLLLYGRYGCRIIGFEIQKSLSDMANRSFKLNGLENSLKSECMDFKEAYLKYNGSFSALVCNPPYFDCKNIKSTDSNRAISRTQNSDFLNGLMLSSNRVLKSGGQAFFCYPAESVCDLFYTMRNNSLEPKELRFVRSKANKPPYLVLVKAKKDGGPGLKITDELIILNADGSESDEIKRIYHR